MTIALCPAERSGRLRRGAVLDPNNGTGCHDLRAYEATYRAQEQLFQRGQDEGSLREFDTRVMAVTYQGAIDTMLAYLDTHPDTDADAYADSLADLLLNAIRRRVDPPAARGSAAARPTRP